MIIQTRLMLFITDHVSDMQQIWFGEYSEIKKARGIIKVIDLRWMYKIIIICKNILFLYNTDTKTMNWK